MARITIDDGTREYIIENKYGQEICKLYFRPGDVSLVSRYHKLKDKFGEIIKPLESLNIAADGTAAGSDEEIKAIGKAEKNLCDLLAELLDTKDAASIFKTRSPFSSVGGRFFCEHVIGAIGGIIDDVMEEEVKASQERVSKYIEDKE